MIKLDKIEAAAHAAEYVAPSPWGLETYPTSDPMPIAIATVSGPKYQLIADLRPVVDHLRLDHGLSHKEANAAVRTLGEYIALFGNPHNVLAMVARIRELEHQLDCASDVKNHLTSFEG